MRIIVRPLSDPHREVDVTERLVAAIAEELWRLYGGNDRLNWLEAERHLARIVGEARTEAAETAVLVAPARRRSPRGAGVQEGPRPPRRRGMDKHRAPLPVLAA
jgi:hypothetical protein